MLNPSDGVLGEFDPKIVRRNVLLDGLNPENVPFEVYNADDSVFKLI